jgi:hypothetical protein
LGTRPYDGCGRTGEGTLQRLIDLAKTNPVVAVAAALVVVAVLLALFAGFAPRGTKRRF